MKTSELIGNITTQVVTPAERFAKSCKNYIRNKHENNVIYLSSLQHETWDCIFLKLARDNSKYGQLRIEDMVGSIKVDVWCKSATLGSISFRKYPKNDLYKARLITNDLITEASDVYVDIAVSNVYDGYTIGYGNVHEHERYTLKYEEDDELSHAYIPFLLFFRLCTAGIAREVSRLTNTAQYVRDGYVIDTTNVKNMCKLTRSDYDNNFKDLVSFRKNYILGEECDAWIQDREIYHYAPLLSEAKSILIYDKRKDEKNVEKHFTLCEVILA